MKAYCKMQVEPMPSLGGSATTIEMCMKSCEAETECQFYSFAKQDKLCKCYSKPNMDCKGYLSQIKFSGHPICEKYYGKNGKQFGESHQSRF